VRVREHNLYFAGLSRRDSLGLILSSVRVLLAGSRGPERAAGQVEALWRERFGGHDAVVFPSARCGIQAVLLALDLKDRNEVLVTGYTCGAVPDAVTAAGAVPAYADVDARTLAIDPARAEASIGPRTGVLICQHTLGIPAPLQDLESVARRHDLVLLEDACLALGSAHAGRPLGSFGDASVFSFELSKTVTAGWGGVVVTRRPGLGERLRKIRDQWGALPRVEAARRLAQAGLSGLLYRPGAYGVTKYLVAILFRSGAFRPSAVAAGDCRAGSDHAWMAVLRQTDRLDETLSHGRGLAERYARVLRRHGWDGGLPDDTTVRLARFPVLVEDPDAWVAHFARRGFELGRWFNAPVSPPPTSGPSPTPLTCPVGTWLGEHMVNFPLHRRMTREDADGFCRILDEYLVSLPEVGRFATPGPRNVTDADAVPTFAGRPR
jgi:dTDP-4-amino-4,6-dideoxygalactose transaminase